jgi:hypothetical protein
MNPNLGRMVAAFSTFQKRRPYWCPVACHPVAEWAFLGPTAPNRGGLKFGLISNDASLALAAIVTVVEAARGPKSETRFRLCWRRLAAG